MSHAFHQLTAPSRWQTAVDTVSFSSLQALERCPRQWQLRRSSWPGFDTLPTRPHPAALEGSIVHDTLDLLFRELSLAGAPPAGSAAFRTVIARLDVTRQIQRRLDAAHETLAHHPRRSTLRLPHDARTLYNRVAQLFQREYAAVERADLPVIPRDHAPAPRGGGPLGTLIARGAMTEVPVAHPTLPVRGVIDLLRRDAEGTHVVDFKTGHVRDEHEAQLALYALLWWRATGDLPASISLRHPRGRAAFPVDTARLVAVEGALAARIEAARDAVAQTPAPARRGEHCVQCDVRPFCDDYWRDLSPIDAQPTTGRRAVDVAVVVPEAVEPNGFVATVGRRRLPVVWEHGEDAVRGPFTVGETLRIVGAAMDGEAVRLTAMTEVFHRG